jgi:DNA-binding GntR family transcriptional regulator
VRRALNRSPLAFDPSGTLFYMSTSQLLNKSAALLSGVEDAADAIEFKVTSSAQQLATTLRDLLLRGTLAPGARLEENKLAARFGVSRNTVREALQLLAHENLVVRALHRTVVVREVGDPADVADLYRARRTLEMAALPLAVTRDRQWHQQLAASLGRIGTAKDRNQLDESDLFFHAILISALGSHRIDGFYARIHTELRLTRGWALRAPVNPKQVVASHRPLVAALSAGSLQKASSTLDDILDTGEQSLLEAIRISAS